MSGAAIRAGAGSGGGRAHGPDARPARPSATTVRAVRGTDRRRNLAVCGALAVVIAAVFMAALATGDFPVTLPEVWFSLTGQPGGNDFIVIELRLPRVLTSLLVGVAFGMSGAIFQALVRNPLASPDIIGITSGASASAVIAIIALGLTGYAVAGFAFAGALVASLVIYLLAYRGGIAGYRLVLIGIGMAALLNAVVSYMMTSSDIYDAQAALVWLTGSVNGATLEATGWLAVCLVVIVPLAVLAAGSLRPLQLGDDTATGLGVALEPARLALIAAGVALASVATAAAGPVAFVAFVSAPIARRLVRGVALVPAGLVGALVVAISDYLAQHAFGEVAFPVGVVTGLIGAPYLLWLLVSTNRVGRGA
ncbi:iron chelate uptake ABC transporter family permease subunit [Micrococcales bacterium 31B]|nr:iron chelate uptake ABC transporter family permease subunit [Micrococcales bacterium 31B]